MLHKRNRYSLTGSSGIRPSSTPVYGDRPAEAENTYCLCLGRCFPSVSPTDLIDPACHRGEAMVLFMLCQISYFLETLHSEESWGAYSLGRLKCKVIGECMIIPSLASQTMEGPAMGGADSRRHGGRFPEVGISCFQQEHAPFVNWVSSIPSC